MTRIAPVDVKNANGPAAEIFQGVKKKMGMVPNIIATMAQSPAVANAYLSFSGALAGGALPAPVRERIALVTGQANECGYCLSAHTLLGKGAGLSDEEVLRARQGTASEPKEAAAVQFAQKLVEQRGNVSDEDVQALRDAGYDDGQIGEIVANVALNIFTNYFNHVADPEIDFPVAPALATA
ncbi:Carboxymuconolactone decarboxylase family protein [Crateriforma conspicua]|uniref:Carboxymuconolactone decarboxylase family protein n=1 Tax=Crateriforma conspicua TaxID=2527996 RepID=A0A5C6FTE1_9PLAN|nr:carboxymuconolactone decarboxylase family protein [Crateriforma conspicua]TWU64730.1 Carboxymuconolactone decarboxylase family protein [Crateriforma conspicua]